MLYTKNSDPNGCVFARYPYVVSPLAFNQQHLDLHSKDKTKKTCPKYKPFVLYESFTLRE